MKMGLFNNKIRAFQQQNLNLFNNERCFFNNKKIVFSTTKKCLVKTKNCLLKTKNCLYCLYCL